MHVDDMHDVILSARILITFYEFEFNQRFPYYIPTIKISK